MLGVGAGLALAGRIPFACSFACFVVGRFETIRISVAYTNANVRIVGTHAGIAIGEDGYSQMGIEDIACVRALPNIPVIQPADRSEEHTSELQSRLHLVCRLLLEKKKKKLRQQPEHDVDN